MPQKTLARSASAALALLVVACAVTEASVGDAPTAGSGGLNVTAGGSDAGLTFDGGPPPNAHQGGASGLPGFPNELAGAGGI